MNIRAYAHNVVNNLITNLPDLQAQMLETVHATPEYPSSWHLEGSVWTHTMMVVSHMLNIIEECSPKNAKALVLAALMHDAGKIVCQEFNKEKQKITFYGHPSVSTFSAYEVLPQLDPELPVTEQLHIMRLVNGHQIPFVFTDDMTNKAYNKVKAKFSKDLQLLDDLMLLRQADTAGRISISEGGTDICRMNLMRNEIALHQSTTQECDWFDKPHAIILVGLPGSGKTTFATNNYKDYTLISRDTCLMELSNGRCYDDAWKYVDHAEVDKNFEKVFNDTLNRKEDLVIDRTNLTYKSRKKFITRLEKAGYDITIQVALADTVTILNRNHNRIGKHIDPEVIFRMMMSFEMPFVSEGEILYYINGNSYEFGSRRYFKKDI